MGALEAIVLGIVQGLTEFLPVSSTGHLRIVAALFSWDDPGAAFTAVTQLGTMLALVVYFRRDLWAIATAWLASLRPGRARTFEARMGWYLLVATVPIAGFGFVFRDAVKTDARDLRLIAAMLIVFGVVMLVADRLGSRTKPETELGLREVIAIGGAQALALIPGVSRSGATISAGLAAGYTREAAARISFLLSIPAVVLSGAFELRDIGKGDGPGAGVTAIATVVAFAVGYVTIAWLLRWLTSHSTAVFVAYRVAIGAFVFLLLAVGTMSAT